MKTPDLTITPEPSRIIAQVRDKHNYVGSQILKPGLTLFAYDLGDGSISPAVYEQVSGSFGRKRVRRVLVTSETCRYVVALNEKNARRKLGV